MLKVLQIGNKAPWPPDDGSSIAVYNMAKGLMDSGVELHLLCINTKKHFKPDSNVPESFKKNTHFQSIYHNTNPNIIGAIINLFSSQSYFVSRFKFSAFKAALTGKLKSQNFDIVQLEGVFMASYISVIRKYSNAKIVLRAHNVEHLIWERHLFRENRFYRKKYIEVQTNRLKRFELHAIKEVDAIIPISKVDEHVFRKLGFSKALLTCMTGVDTAAYNSTDVIKKAKSIFYIGSMDWLPNQEAVWWFIRNCWPIIIKKIPDARFFVGGKGMPLQFFHITQPGIHIIENVPNAMSFFMEHEVMVVPLLSGSGIRIKIIEGMAYGKAIVSTTVGAEGIEYTNDKNIFIADDPETFAEKVIQLIQNPKMRETIETEAKDFAKSHFDNKQVVKPLVEFYTNWIND